jgi:hypothetical protein
VLQNGQASPRAAGAGQKPVRLPGSAQHRNGQTSGERGGMDAKV